MDLGPLAPPADLRCAHLEAVPVRTSLTNELVAWLCPDCDEQLDADWDPELIDIARAGMHLYNHHGRPDFHLPGCPLCAKELRT